MPLLPSAQLPDYAAEFDSAAPSALKGCSPPFLTALPEPGTLQMWTGLIAETARDWHLLVRSPVNLPQAGGICLFEGIVETDRWFGPLFTNMRFTRSHMPVRLRADYPLVQVQPVPRHGYSNDTLDRMDVTSTDRETLGRLPRHRSSSRTAVLTGRLAPMLSPPESGGISVLTQRIGACARCHGHAM